MIAKYFKDCLIFFFKYKAILIMIFFAPGFSIKVHAQALIVEWEKTYGGSDSDQLRSIKKLPEGGFIAVGFSTSSNGDIQEPNKGSLDFWIIKINNKGALLWSRTFGGSEADDATSVALTEDGGCIAIGYTESSNGDVIGNNGGSDIWAIKLNSSGGLEWKKCFGGFGFDEGRDIIPTNDGNFLIASRSTVKHTGQNVSSSINMGIFKINPDGLILWQKYFGGTGDDEAWSVIQTTDGGYITTGVTNSKDGNVTGNHGDRDFWVVKLDDKGGLEWQKCLGGIDYFALSNSIVQMADKGYLVTGHVFQKSPFTGGNNDINVYHGNWDTWCVKLDQAGDVVWQNSPGINLYDWGNDAVSTADGGAIVVGGKAGAGNDYWIFKLNNTGDIDWELALGGRNDEEAFGIESDGCGYVISGGTRSTDGLVSANNGGQDGWLVKLSPKPYLINITSSPSNRICPGQQVVFNSVIASDIVNPSYQWRKNGLDVGLNRGDYTDNTLVDGDKISVIVKSGCQSVESNRISLDVVPFQIEVLPLPSEILAGQYLNIITSSNQNYRVVAWEPISLFSDQTAISQLIAPETSMIIKIIAFSENGCSDSVLIDIKVKDYVSKVTIPNAFSPNGDGINDRWSPILGGGKNISVKIFNRFGAVLYSQDKYSDGDFWDGRYEGTELPAGVYYYLIHINDSSETYSGSLTLIK